MRTTVSIHDELLAAAKERARERGVSLGTVVEDGLRRELNAPVGPGPEIPVFRGGGGFVPDIDPTSNSALREYLDEGLPPEKLR